MSLGSLATAAITIEHFDRPAESVTIRSEWGVYVHRAMDADRRRCACALGACRLAIGA